jgi:hypothetical protein
MKRVLLLVTVASMLAASMALSVVAQAAPIGGNKANAQCRAEAVRTLQPGFKPSNYTFIGGTAGNDRVDGLGSNDAPDVICGFGGVDSIGTLEADDIFLGGAGNDVVGTNYGTSYGGAGDDVVDSINYGTFYGGEGDDQVLDNFGTFYGGAGNDYVDNNEFGTFVQ